MSTDRCEYIALGLSQGINDLLTLAQCAKNSLEVSPPAIIAMKCCESSSAVWSTSATRFHLGKCNTKPGSEASP